MSGILILNAGSSSLKFAVYRAANEPDQLLSGQVDRIGKDAHLILKLATEKTSEKVHASTHSEALDAVLKALKPRLKHLEVSGVGHRIVHGGLQFNAPVELTADTINELKDLIPLAPLHQPHNIAAVEAACVAFPNAVQIGCFDTAFHRGHPWVNDTFALPRKFYENGIRRYGFHGLSYDYITGVITRDFPDLADGRIIVAHLGNGASMCAVRNGESVGSTMGFSALDGLPMGTRCGQIDPGVLFYLIEQQGMTPADVVDMLYKQSGLLGLSGFSSDMRELLASDKKEAAEAIDYYVFRARREIGALAAVLKGVDALVFCGGIGENAGPIRERISDGLEFLGIDIDPSLNSSNAVDIGTGRARVLVIPTDEERVIARAVNNMLF